MLPFKVTMCLILSLLTPTDGLHTLTQSERQMMLCKLSFKIAPKSRLMRTDRAGTGMNIKSLNDVVMFWMICYLQVCLSSAGAKGKALKSQTQAGGSPTSPPLLVLLPPVNRNEADCQSGSIVSTVGPTVRLLKTQDNETKTSMKLCHTDK